MPSSTSLNSTSALPSASSRLSRSLSGNFQPTTPLTSGNRPAQLGSNSSLKPTLAASPLNVTVQILSRSALENSQVPIMALAESPGGGGGVCAEAAAARPKMTRQIGKLRIIRDIHLPVRPRESGDPG